MDHLAEQRYLEDKMLGAGAARFRKRLAEAVASGRASEEGAGIKLLQRAVEPTEQAIEAWLGEQKGKNGRPNVATRWIEQVGAGVGAFMVAKTVLDSVYERPFLRHVAMEVATLVFDELRWRELEEKRPGLFRYRLTRLTDTRHYGYKRASMEQTVRYAVECPRADEEPLDLEYLNVSPDTKMYLGTKLIDLFIGATGLVECKKQKSRAGGKPRNELRLEPTEATLAWIDKRNDYLEFLTPVQLPTVVPPKPWTVTERGGYYFALRDRHPFVRSAQDHDVPEVVLDAVNTLQDTAWAVNKPVLKLIEEIRQRGKAVAGLPAYESLPLPAKPVDIATNEAARREWRKAAHLVHKSNRLRAERVIDTDKVLQVAHMMADYESFYFPHNVDFRGRVYPIPVYMHPQGNDLAKSLLTFADVKPLGEMGAYYLAIHGANLLDVLPDGTKVKTMTLDERSSWIQQNTLRIVAVADDPWADLWWTEADKPLQFYAFCVEWAGFWQAYQQGKPFEYMCGLPVAQDGSCNGLQHFAAMLRDEVGARATNVTANERPEDVYEVVSEDVARQIERILADPDSHTILEGKSASDYQLAQMWVKSGKLGRKLAKRPTMTFGYGSKRFGFADQLLDFLREDRQEWLHLSQVFTTEDGTEVAPDACRFMAGLIWQSLQSTVVAAAEGMEWLQECAGHIARAGQPVRWKVPGTGFPVTQGYYEINSRQIKTILAGQVVKPTLWSNTNEPRVAKQRNAVSPNLVHSLDAAVLMHTVLNAAFEGVYAFGMVHDSFATVPADCETLALVTRDVFYRFYTENDVIGMIHAQFVEQHGECPEPPKPGSLDLREVYDSRYFFS